MISILVPIYNIEDYLPHCLDSIINQTFKDVEIILVDDGSSDYSGHISDDYAKLDDRIRVIHTGNNGAIYARNVGLRVASGEYIMMVDGDDVLHPQMIETLYKMIKSGDYDFSMCYGEMIFDVDVLKRKIKDSFVESDVEDLSCDSCLRDLYLGGKNVEIQYHVLWNKLYRRELLANLFFVNTASYDTEFNNRVYQRIDKAILTKEILYYWIQRTTSTTHQGYNERYANVIHSYLVCLNEIPKTNELYRSLCLRRMYRVMSSIRYWSRGANSHALAVSHCKLLLTRTSKEFFQNSYIPLSEKLVLLLFNYCPVVYSVYVTTAELWARIR